MYRNAYRNSEYSGKPLLAMHAPWTKSGDILSSDRFGWPVDDIASNCVLDWADGDGENPKVGPTLTTTGTPESGKPLPLKTQNGTDLTQTLFWVGEALTSDEFVDPEITNDAIIISFFTPFYGSPRPIATLPDFVGASRGFQLASITGSEALIAETDGDTAPQSTTSLPSNALAFAVFVVKRGGTQRLYLNGVKEDEDTAPAGSWASGGKVGIGTLPDITSTHACMVVRNMIFFGDGIADICDDAWNLELANAVLANKVLNTDIPLVMNRESCAAWEVDGEWYVASRNMPRTSPTKGYLAEGARENLCKNNINIQTVNAWTSTWGAPTVVNDFAGLEAKKRRNFGPYVIQYANTSGGPQYLYNGDQTGDTDKYSMQVFGHITAGSGAEIGWFDTSSSVFTKVADLDSDYARTIANSLTPPDTDVVFCIHVPDSCTVRAVMNTLEKGEFASTPIPNWDDTLTVTRLQDLNPIDMLPEDAQGRIDAIVESEGWSTIPPEDVHFFSSSLGGSNWGYTTATGVNFIVYDGTNVTAIYQALTGNPQEVMISWGGRLYVEIEGKGSDENSYDGDFTASGVWGFGVRNTASPFAWCRDLKLYRSET